MQLHRQPQALQRAGSKQRVQPLEHELELQPILPADKADEVEETKLRVPLEEGTQRRACSLFDVVEEDDRAIRQRRAEHTTRSICRGLFFLFLFFTLLPTYLLRGVCEGSGS